MRTFVLFALLFLVHGPAAVAQTRRAVSDDEIVRESRLVARGARIELYAHDGFVQQDFLKLLEDAYSGIEKVLGRPLDTATLGPTVRVYVSNGVSVSHIWRGYNHPRDPRAAVFLSARVVSPAFAARNATYIHELTHLFTWRYSSLTLREGLADTVALALMPGSAVGPVGAQERPEVSREILDELGKNQMPPDWMVSSPAARSAFYYASRRFVQCLIELQGMAAFLELYASTNPAEQMKKFYGLNRDELVVKCFSGS